MKSPDEPPPLLLLLLEVDGAGAWYEEEELGVQAASSCLLDSLQTCSDEEEGAGAASGVHWLLEEDGATH